MKLESGQYSLEIECCIQVGIVIVENKQKVQGKFSKYFILPPAGLEEGTSKPI